MSASFFIVFCFTFVIHLISTLAYAVRLVGVKTGRIAVSGNKISYMDFDSLVGMIYSDHIINTETWEGWNIEIKYIRDN